MSRFDRTAAPRTVVVDLHTRTDAAARCIAGSSSQPISSTAADGRLGSASARCARGALFVAHAVPLLLCCCRRCCALDLLRNYIPGIDIPLPLKPCSVTISVYAFRGVGPPFYFLDCDGSDGQPSSIFSLPPSLPPSVLSTAMRSWPLSFATPDRHAQCKTRGFRTYTGPQIVRTNLHVAVGTTRDAFSGTRSANCTRQSGAWKKLGLPVTAAGTAALLAVITAQHTAVMIASVSSIQQQQQLWMVHAAGSGYQVGYGFVDWW